MTHDAVRAMLAAMEDRMVIESEDPVSKARARSKELKRELADTMKSVSHRSLEEFLNTTNTHP